MSRFYQDRCKQIFEEIEPGRLRGVTDLAGDRYISDNTVPKSSWEHMRGPLVEVPDPWIPDSVKLLRVEDVVARWESLRTKPGSAPHAYLLAEIKAALGHQLPEEEP